MNDKSSAREAEIIYEGLASYWDAIFAIGEFQNKIQEISKAILHEKLDTLKSAFQVDEVPEHHRWLVDGDCELGRVVLGAAYGWRSSKDLWEINMRLGIGWRPTSGGEGRAPMAGIEIGDASQKKMRPICRALKAQSDLNPLPEDFHLYDWPEHLRFVVYLPLSEGSTVDEIRDKLRNVLDCFAGWSRGVGGLKNVLYPPGGPAPLG